MGDELFSKSIAELSRLIESHATSSVELVQTYLDRIKVLNPSINAIVTIAPDVLDRARACDFQLATEKNLAGALLGIPITIKDTIATEGIRTTLGSRLRADDVPDRDAPVVARLKAAGAIILGKTNTPEMAIPYETDNPVFGRTNNPHDLKRTPGGSSGGEAAAIAANLSPAGIGSDLSGSIRVPAHFCGIAALKPTSGVAPMEGHTPTATGILALGACIGPMARRVADLAVLFSVIANRPDLQFLDKAIDRIAGSEVAWYIDDGISPVCNEIVDAVRIAANILRDAGFKVREDRPPKISEGQRLWVELFSGVASEQISRFYRGREDEAGPLVSPLLRQKNEPTFEEKIAAAESLAKAVVEREHMREEVLQWMKQTPLILTPVSATPAFEHGASRVTINDESMSVFRSCSYAQTVNVLGFPAVVVPVTRTSAGLPVGVQIIGRPFAEHDLLGAAAIIERGARFW